MPTESVLPPASLHQTDNADARRAEPNSWDIDLDAVTSESRSPLQLAAWILHVYRTNACKSTRAEAGQVQ